MSDISQNQDLDLTLLREIADGSDEFIVESIEMFLQQTPESLQQVDEAINAQDWPRAASAAHKLKATLGFFGMLISQALIQDIEHSCKAGSPDANVVAAKFKQVQGYIADNSRLLIQLKAETKARL